MGALLMLIHIALVVLCIIRDRRSASTSNSPYKSDVHVSDKDWDSMQGSDSYQPPKPSV
jgi:hypothetical protein